MGWVTSNNYSCVTPVSTQQTIVKEDKVSSDKAMADISEDPNPGFKLLLRDINPRMIEAWVGSDFGTLQKYKTLVEITKGDIFDGAPTADAIVSPANSFGFMDGGIDMAYSRHFGWQMQERLQEVIKKEHGGELLVGSAIIIPSYPPGTDYSTLGLPVTHNEGKPIKYLISAPTMRIPMDVCDTVNAYLAFRAVLRAVVNHNASCQQTGQDPIHSVLCPGLGTAVGRMPFKRCALQMVTAYEAVIYGTVKEFSDPSSLAYATMKHIHLTEAGKDSGTAFERKAYPGEIFAEKKT